MKKSVKKLALILIILYAAQAIVGIYFGIKAGIQISNEIQHTKL